MTEALISISPNGQIQSIRYYTITSETLEGKLISNELLLEVLNRAKAPEGKDWHFKYEDFQVEILKKYDYKIEFFASRDVGKWIFPESFPPFQIPNFR